MSKILLSGPDSKKPNQETVGAALAIVAAEFGCEVKDLNCELADAFTAPYSGRSVWVWPKSQEFDPDKVWILGAPVATIMIWAKQPVFT